MSDDYRVRGLLMLFVLYLILLLGGMVVMGLSFASPVLPALMFVGGLLLVVLAVALPVSVGLFEQRK